VLAATTLFVALVMRPLATLDVTRCLKSKSARKAARLPPLFGVPRPRSAQWLFGAAMMLIALYYLAVAHVRLTDWLDGLGGRG
jgi:hypothetical protein